MDMLKNFCFWIITLSMLLNPCFVRADEAKPAAAVEAPKAAGVAPIAFETQTLDNGLRVIYAPLRQAPVVHVRVFYHVGSKDERPDRQGSPGLEAAETAAPGAAGALQSLRGVSA